MLVLNLHLAEVKPQNAEESMAVKELAEEREDLIAVNQAIDTHK